MPTAPNAIAAADMSPGAVGSGVETAAQHQQRNEAAAHRENASQDRRNHESTPERGRDEEEKHIHADDQDLRIGHD